MHVTGQNHTFPHTWDSIGYVLEAQCAQFIRLCLIRFQYIPTIDSQVVGMYVFVQCVYNKIMLKCCLHFVSALQKLIQQISLMPKLLPKTKL